MRTLAYWNLLLSVDGKLERKRPCFYFNSILF